MKISLSWLKKYIDLPESVPELCDILTFSGIEVEAVRELPALPETIITALVLDARPVEGSDHLKLCKIGIGSYTLQDRSVLSYDGSIQVVCGAPNCVTGMKAILALPGTDLGEIKIKSAKLRGQVSHGMLCSERELGLSEDHGGIISLPEDTPLGVSPNALFELPDTVLELEITPNRSDLLGYYGIARDLSASLNRPLKTYNLPDLPSASTTLKLNLEIKDFEKCPRYTARIFEGVSIGESPLWLKLALSKSGLRSINNVVDITNYVLLASGQPLHAFDYDLLKKLIPEDSCPTIQVRRAHNGEQILALDGISYRLSSDDLVIADGQRATAIAGVMGGEETGINASTRNIVLEIAAFDSSTIRRTSYKHKISSDSSYRFERQLTPWSLDEAQKLASVLICNLAKPSSISDVIDHHVEQATKQILALRPCRFTEIIGYELTDSDIRSLLEKLGLDFVCYGHYQEHVTDIKQVYCHHAEEARAGKTEFTEIPGCIHSHYYYVPYYRVDLTREIDLIEELARLGGYDRVPRKLVPSRIMDRHAHKTMQSIEDYMISSGYFEVLNYSFADPESLKKLGFKEGSVELLNLVNPQASQLSVMRISLLPSVLENLRYNLNHGERNLKLFELSKTYHLMESKPVEKVQLLALATGSDNSEHWSVKQRALSFYDIKGCLEQLLELFGLTAYQIDESRRPYHAGFASNSYSVEGIEIACFGMIKPDVAEAFEIDTITLKQEVWSMEIDLTELIEVTRDLTLDYKPVSKYPLVSRDISFLLKKDYSYRDLQNLILSIDPELIERLSIFDEYYSDKMPAGYRSVSLHLFIRDSQKTLTEERIDQLVASVLKALEQKLEIIMR